MEDAAAEMARMEEVESARREQQKLSGVKEGKEKQSRKMFRVVWTGIRAHRCNGGGRFFCLWYNGAVVWWAEVQIGNRQIVKERIEDGANEKAALRFPIAALSFASISIFP